MIGLPQGATVQLLRSARFPRHPKSWCLLFCAVLLGLLLPSAVLAQTATAPTARQSIADQVNALKLKPIPLPPPTALPPPDTSQTKLGADATTSVATQFPEQPKANTTTAIPAKSVVAGTSVAPSEPLKPKYDVSLIGQRDVSSGVNFYSLDREMALGKDL